MTIQAVLAWDACWLLLLQPSSCPRPSWTACNISLNIRIEADPSCSMCASSVPVKPDWTHHINSWNLSSASTSLPSSVDQRSQPRSVDSWSSIKACFLPTCTLASEALSRRQKRSAVGTADHSRQGSTNPPQHHPQNPKMHEFRKVPASSKLYTGISGEARVQARERLFKFNPYP